MNSHSQTPGQREWAEMHTPGHGRRNHVASSETTDLDYERQTEGDDNVARQTSNDGHRLCRRRRRPRRQTMAIDYVAMTSRQQCRDDDDDDITMMSITPTR